MKKEEVTELLKKYLRQNVSDPLDRGVTWIMYGYPRKRINYPTIALFQTGGRSEAVGVGHQQRRLMLLYEIEILTNKEAEATINGKRYSGYKLVSLIADRVVSALTSKFPDMKAESELEDLIILRTETLPYDPVLDEYREIVFIEVTFVSS